MKYFVYKMYEKSLQTHNMCDTIITEIFFKLKSFKMKDKIYFINRLKGGDNHANG